MKTRLYDLVKKLLTDHPALRDSDKKLIWKVWDELNFLHSSSLFDVSIGKVDFMKAPSTESIRRCRQKIQEKHPELRGSESVTKMRKVKEDTKGTWVYKETAEEQQTLI